MSIFIFLFSLVFFLNCGGDSGLSDEASVLATAPVVYENPIFKNTSRISASLTPTNSSSPKFTWTATHHSFVMIAIFNAKISVKDNRIENTNNLIWMWTSELGTSFEGDVRYSDGLPVSFGNPLIGQVPTPLTKGTYYWALWTYNSNADLRSSSTEYTHVVLN